MYEGRKRKWQNQEPYSLYHKPPMEKGIKVKMIKMDLKHSENEGGPVAEESAGFKSNRDGKTE